MLCGMRQTYRGRHLNGFLHKRGQLHFASSLVTSLVLAYSLIATVIPTADDPLTRYGTPDGTVIRYRRFLLSPDHPRRSALWTIEYLTPAILHGDANRAGIAFKPSLDASPEFRASNDDYALTGYDKGHLVPANDLGAQAAMVETFTLLNVTPQLPDFNRRSWLALENHIRDIVLSEGSHGRVAVWCITCPVYVPPRGVDAVTVKFIGRNMVAIPPFCGKAVLIQRGDASNLECKSWIMPNTDGNSDNLNTFAVTTDEFERRSGLECWRKLPQNVQQRLEAVR